MTPAVEVAPGVLRRKYTRELMLSRLLQSGQAAVVMPDGSLVLGAQVQSMRAQMEAERR